MRSAGAPVTVVDVREPWETALCALPDSIHMPLGELPGRFRDLPSDRTLVMVCHHGVRSAHAALFLVRQGYSRVLNLAGGINAWAKRIDPEMETY